MKTTPGKAAVLLAALLVLTVSGCAGPEVREGKAPEAGPGRTEGAIVNLLAGNYFFTPNRVTVPAGEPVTVRIHNNASIVPHAFVLEGPDGRAVVRRELIAGGVTTLRLPALPEGTYPFYCDKSFSGSGMSHREKGMEGTLTVAKPPGPERPEGGVPRGGAGR